MRLGVVDVGSNTVRLVIAERGGEMPLPVYSSKRRLRLAERVEADGRLGRDAVDDLAKAVGKAEQEAADRGVSESFVFATAAVREAPNRQQVLAEVHARTGVHLHVMPGVREAELAFTAARHWMGWRAGPMVLLDIGGGSLEIAVGRGRMPDFAVSLPLGAGRLTREHLNQDVLPDPAALRLVRRRIRHELRDVAARIQWEGPRTAVATSRTFHQLARLCAAGSDSTPPKKESDRLTRRGLKAAVGTLASLTAPERAQLPGISPARAHQSLAGALIAHTTMRLLHLDQAVLCPWAVREGVLLTALNGNGSTELRPTAPLPQPAAEPAALPASVG